MAGVGTRLRPHTYTQPKPLIPVAGKPIIAYIVDQLIDAGVKEFVFVIGHLGEKIQAYIEAKYTNVSVKFVHQEHRMGLGHAVWMSKEALGDCDQLFIVLGDIIFDADLRGMIECETNCLGLKVVEDPRRFGVAEVSDDGFVTTLIEKPKIPKSNLAIAGLYSIRDVKALFDALDHNISHDIRTVEEYQLTDALMRMIELGNKFSFSQVNNWFDCGKKEILLETNSMLLKRHHQDSANKYEFPNTIIIPPVSIGNNCIIKNSIIGPCVSIGDNATIQSSIIKDSIIGNFSEMDGVVLHKSVIGNDASLRGFSQSLNIGDDTEIDFG